MSGKYGDDEGGGEVLQVFVRVRPPLSKELRLENAVTVSGGQSIGVRSEKYDVNCRYDKVFDDSTEQATVFDSVRPLLSSVLNGYNACLFAYGQTSAGKSHTMLGPNGGTTAFLKTPKGDWGIIPRAVEFIFNEMYRAADDGYLSYKVKASFVQIYNENLYDLLKDSGPFSEDNKLGNTSSFGKQGEQGGLKIREIPRPGRRNAPPQYEVYISGLSEFRVQTEEDVMQLLEVGTRNRATRSTDFNDTSSRSHAILQLTFELEKQNDAGQVMLIRSKLSFADLAGSEKMGAVDQLNEAKHIRELAAINQSLSSLGNVIAALSTNKVHIPYRDSKLTRILQDSLGGNTRTIVIVCVSPTALHAMETVSTLQFADRAKSVMLKVRANTVVDDKDLLARANAEIARLKVLLRQALKNNEKGILKSGSRGGEYGIGGMGSKGDLVVMNENNTSGTFNMNGTGSSNNANSNMNSNNTSTKQHGVVSRNVSGDLYESTDRHTEQHNEITLQLFEENEKLKKENIKMRQALEWSIKLAKKKKSEEVEFDNAPAEDIHSYRHVLNSIDLSPSALGSTGSRKESSRSRDELPNIFGGSEKAPYTPDNQFNMSRGVSFQGLGASNRDLTGFRSPSNDRRGSAGSAGGTPLTNISVIPTGIPTGKKKKKRGKSMSLPSLFRTEKELDYLEYISNVHNNLHNPPAQASASPGRTAEMITLSSYMGRTDDALKAYGEGNNKNNNNYISTSSDNNIGNLYNANNNNVKSDTTSSNTSHKSTSVQTTHGPQTHGPQTHGPQTHGQQTRDGQTSPKRDGQLSPKGSRTLTIDTERTDKLSAIAIKSQQQLLQQQQQYQNQSTAPSETDDFKQLEGEIYNTRKEVERGRDGSDPSKSPLRYKDPNGPKGSGQNSVNKQAPLSSSTVGTMTVEPSRERILTASKSYESALSPSGHISSTNNVTGSMNSNSNSSNNGQKNNFSSGIATGTGTGAISPLRGGQNGSSPGPGGQNGVSGGQYGASPGPNGASGGQYGASPGPNGVSGGQYGASPGPNGVSGGQYGSSPGPNGASGGQYGSSPGPNGASGGQYGSSPGPNGASGGQYVGSIANAVKESGFKIRPIPKQPEVHHESPASLPQMLMPNLTFTHGDIGMVIQLFSFRYDCWGNMTITDFDPMRGVHKCRLSDGTIQWLDLKKKPIRALVEGDKTMV